MRIVVEKFHLVVLALISGAVLPLAFAPFAWWWLAPLCVLVLFWVWQDQTPKRAFWLSYAFGFASFLTGTYWLHISLHGYGGLSWALTLPLMLGLMAIMALYPALTGYVCNRWAPQATLWRWLLILPAVWTGFEWLRGWLLSGFPWLSLGISQVDSPLAGFSPIVGQYGVTFLVTFTAGCLFALIKTRKWEHFTLVIVIVWAGGYWLHDNVQWSPAKSAEPISVSLVQGGIDQGQKWDEEQLLPTARLYYDLTQQEFGRDLIIWPEAAIPHLHHVLEFIYDELRAEALENNSTLVLGSIEYDFDKDQYFNGVLMLGEPDQVYHKRHLVPFGEYFPVPPFVRNWLRLQNLPYLDYTRGQHPPHLLSTDRFKIAPLLCYEAAYGAEQLYAFPEANLFVNVSNDGWFGDSIAAHQHLQIARLRAQEFQRPLLRATNNGITAIVDAKGDIRARLPQFEAGVLRGEITPAWGYTPYSRWGNWPVLAMVLIGITVLWRKGTV